MMKRKLWLINTLSKQMMSAFNWEDTIFVTPKFSFQEIALVT